MTETMNTTVQPGSAPASVSTPAVSTSPYTASTAPTWVPNATPQYFTAEDVEKIRQQEKEKLYQRLESQQTQINEFRTAVEELRADKKARDEELAKQQKAASDAARSAEEEKLTAQELIKSQREQMEKEQAKLREDMEMKIALMQKEQEFLQVKAYIQRRVAEEIAANNIIPDIAEYVNGTNQEEIEASIAKAREKTANIVKGAQSMMSPVPGGVSPTGGPSGPLDNLSGPRQMTLEELKAMPVNSPEYMAYRRQQGLDRAGNGQGLFG